jgi:hypothetical protein
VLIVDEFQRALIENDFNQVVQALKSAGDAIKPRPRPPDHLSAGSRHLMH